MHSPLSIAYLTIFSGSVITSAIVDHRETDGVFTKGSWRESFLGDVLWVSRKSKVVSNKVNN